MHGADVVGDQRVGEYADPVAASDGIDQQLRDVRARDEVRGDQDQVALELLHRLQKRLSDFPAPRGALLHDLARIVRGK
jgi:hypothetical protein